VRLRRFIPRYSLRTLVVFLLLATSGVGLWWRWEAWYVRRRLPSGLGVSSAEFSADGRRITIERHTNDMLSGRHSFRSVSDAETGACVVSEEIDFADSRQASGLPANTMSTSPDGARSVAFEILEVTENGLLAFRDDPCVEVRDVATGTVLATLVRGDPAVVSAVFSPDGESILTASLTGDIRIWVRRRPEWWWGVFWLWEFWLTVAFACLFIWSVYRDRRALAPSD